MNRVKCSSSTNAGNIIPYMVPPMVAERCISDNMLSMLLLKVIVAVLTVEQ